MPALKEATQWVAIETAWGYARALASELCWLGENRTSSSVATGAAPTSAVHTAIFSQKTLPTRCGEDLEGKQPFMSGAKANEAQAERDKAAAGFVGNIQHPDYDVYCICRGGDDGRIMVSCDACSEWFHASWCDNSSPFFVAVAIASANSLCFKIGLFFLEMALTYEEKEARGVFESPTCCAVFFPMASFHAMRYFVY